MVSKVDVTDADFSRLKMYNWGMGGLHLIQAILILVLATDFTLPVTSCRVARISSDGSSTPSRRR